MVMARAAIVAVGRASSRRLRHKSRVTWRHVIQGPGSRVLPPPASHIKMPIIAAKYLSAIFFTAARGLILATQNLIMY